MSLIEKIIIISVGILAIYGLWILILLISVKYARRNSAHWRTQAQTLLPIATKWQQNLAGFHSYFKDSTQVVEPPYADPVARARRTAGDAKVLADRCVKRAEEAGQRQVVQRPLSQLPLVIPHLSETADWISWTLETRRIASDLERLRTAWQTLSALDTEISNQGPRVKRLYLDLQTLAHGLQQQRAGLVNPTNPLTTEGIMLTSALETIDMVLSGPLSADAPSRPDVVYAYAWYEEIRRNLDSVSLKLRQPAAPSQDARDAIMIADQQLNRLEHAVGIHWHTYAPCPNLWAQVLSLKQRLDVAKGLFMARTFEPALQQGQQLAIETQSLHTALDQVQWWRIHVAQLYAEAQTALVSLERDVAQAGQAYVMNVTAPLLEEARSLSQQLEHLRTSEDLTQLIAANDMKRRYDAKLVQITLSMRDFDARSKAYEALSTQINPASVEAACQRSDDLAAKLAASDDIYQRQIAPVMLSVLRKLVERAWQPVALQVVHPQENQLEWLVKVLAHPLQLQEQLNQQCDLAAQVLRDQDVDQQNAQSFVAEIDQMMPICLVTAGNSDTNALATVASFQSRREELYKGLHQAATIPTNFDALHVEASLVLVNMKNFIACYRSQVLDTREALDNLRQVIDNNGRELQDLKNHATLDLLVAPQVTAGIRAWLDNLAVITADTSLRDMQAMLDAGNKLLSTTRLYIDTLTKDMVDFLADQKRVETHAAAISDRLALAKQSGRGYHVDDTQAQPDRIAAIQQQFDKSTSMLAHLSNSQPRYTLQNGQADLRLADSMLDYTDLMIKNL